MNSKRNQHVVSRADGRAVSGESTEHASGVHSIKAEATVVARGIARN